MIMNLRKYTSDDSKATYELFYNTVHSVNATDYTKKQLDAWAPKEMDLLAWNKRVLRNSNALIAEFGGVIVGLGTADNKGYFDLLYVHKDYQGIGIASMIADNIESCLYSDAVQTITADVSITAKHHLTMYKPLLRTAS
jgi:putative acetyltransferase